MSYKRTDEDVWFAAAICAEIARLSRLLETDKSSQIEAIVEAMKAYLHEYGGLDGSFGYKAAFEYYVENYIRAVNDIKDAPYRFAKPRKSPKADIKHGHILCDNLAKKKDNAIEDLALWYKGKITDAVMSKLTRGIN